MLCSRAWWKVSLLFSMFLFSAETVRADVKLPKVFGNGMVLQQQTPVAVWGTADVDEEVAVTLGATSVAAKTGANGKWTVQLATPAAGGPFELIVKGKNSVTFSDVYVGEVWVCSGQSNMEWTVAISANAAEEAKNANYPLLRMLNVQKNIADKPLDDINGEWRVCTPANTPHFSAVGYYFARHLHKELNVPVGIINTSWGGTICEAWTSRDALAAVESLKHFAERPLTINPQQMNPNQPAALFNAMVNPLVPYGIRGALWYQGESNRDRAEQYRTLFPTMIADWRARFGRGDFPFYFVQLAPFQYGQEDPRILAELWEAQSKTLLVPNTGMAVTTDITELQDIHPKNKQDVGRRLALWALAKNYGKNDLVYSGPLYESQAVEGNKIRLKFQHVGGGLVAKESQPLSHFTIAGADQQFVEATAVIEGETIVVTSDKVPQPVAVRFAWHKLATPNFFNQAGLPASPFRTDDWPLVTAGRK